MNKNTQNNDDDAKTLEYNKSKNQEYRRIMCAGQWYIDEYNGQISIQGITKKGHKYRKTKTKLQYCQNNTKKAVSEKEI